MCEWNRSESGRGGLNQDFLDFLPGAGIWLGVGWGEGSSWALARAKPGGVGDGVGAGTAGSGLPVTIQLTPCTLPWIIQPTNG